MALSGVAGPQEALNYHPGVAPGIAHLSIPPHTTRFFRETPVLFERIAQRWTDLLRRGRTRQTGIVGIYGQPRGGTNFIAAALHYHPRLFAVNEHVFDHRVPLRSMWSGGSVFREDGRQDKKIDEVDWVVFNKMQEFFPEQWNPRASFPEASRFIFYFRNPIRVHLSREAFRQKHKPQRTEWTGTRENFLSLLTEAQEILEAHEILKQRHPCFLLSHEYFCCEHDQALPDLHRFLDVDPLPPGNPRHFLHTCGRCGRVYTPTQRDGKEWLVCPRHRHPVTGCGHFNPLAPIDRKGVLDASWKTTPGIDQMMADVRRMLGSGFADYFWNGNYSQNLPAPRALANAA
jgi:hypothetical protein